MPDGPAIVVATPGAEPVAPTGYGAALLLDGRLLLGTWQQIFHLECDVKPRERRVVVTILGEPA